MNKTSTAELLSLWSSRITEVESNGYAIRRYCLDRNLKEKRYYSWRKKIRNLENSTHEFTKLTFSPSSCSVSSGFSVSFGNGLCIIPEIGFNETEFLRTVHILREL
jgi:hypothetical protein